MVGLNRIPFAETDQSFYNFQPIILHIRFYAAKLQVTRVQNRGLVGGSQFILALPKSHEGSMQQIPEPPTTPAFSRKETACRGVDVLQRWNNSEFYRTLPDTARWPESALCDQGLTPAELTAILSNAFEMKQFERGTPRVVCGMAGDELARDIIANAGLTPPNAERPIRSTVRLSIGRAGFWPMRNG